MSSGDDLSILMTFGKLRRQLNLMATHAMKPLGIGPKQALLLRELRELKSGCLNEIARQTQTDPAATGKIIDSLIRKGWVQRKDHPQDRRRWQVSLTAEGAKAARKLDLLYRSLAKDFSKPLSRVDKTSLCRYLTQISACLEAGLSAVKDKAS